MDLTKAEEQIMRYLWKLEKAYLKNILDEFPYPKPAATTIATLLKRVIDKGFVGFSQHGSNREYFPLIKKTDYFSKQVNLIIRDYFNNSASQFASFFTNETDLNLTDLEEIKRLVDQKIKNQKKSK
ncbi:MAG TPA: BlaI/MecI/CopY family transcriptional regulator [Bacteroidales bacterium]|jgi:predicted transcriptional regulator|nr:BlaI/MecI/CopY family transcriptional regulator [Bacteroidales bacterium]OQB59093.1 MAG: Methicillin resistance regulatory protein MecI [Bacteroidetes bacterium ADurb.Bin145]HOU03536.1 BlaI/MecI/CopY family transcriptional regulator [Bacteroidales bacterium]HQK68964.1 BlaI/MecI/CopY family transcriptional regulator [Bacteroidales bacterium]